MRGQAAIEYLTTYGWMILIVLVAVGALAYFGVIDTTKYAPVSCQLDAGIVCVDQKLNPGSINLVLANSFGRDIDALNITISTPECNDTLAFGPLGDRDQTGILTLCAMPLPERVRGMLLINYRFKDDAVSHELRGTISLRREKS